MSPTDLVRLSRPRQWVKNVFVLAPLLFSGRLGNAVHLENAFLAFASFCLLSGAVYAINDVADARADRAHPRKRLRPVASGRVSPAVALALAAFLAAVGLALAYVLPGPDLPGPVVWVGAAYLANSLLYCLWLKYRVIVDVLLIAIGFVLRLLAGCAAISVVPSSWILVCGFSLALVLGFGKRRTEVANLSGRGDYREVLGIYDEAKLNMLVGICTAVCLMSYMLYTVAPETAQLHGTQNLVYTVPFVAYGLFRYAFKVMEGKGDGPTDILLRDPAFFAIGAIWAGSVVAVLYLDRLF